MQDRASFVSDCPCQEVSLLNHPVLLPHRRDPLPTRPVRKSKLPSFPFPYPGEERPPALQAFPSKITHRTVFVSDCLAAGSHRAPTHFPTHPNSLMPSLPSFSQPSLRNAHPALIPALLILVYARSNSFLCCLALESNPAGPTRGSAKAQVHFGGPRRPGWVPGVRKHIFAYPRVRKQRTACSICSPFSFESNTGYRDPSGLTSVSGSCGTG